VSYGRGDELTVLTSAPEASLRKLVSMDIKRHFDSSTSSRDVGDTGGETGKKYSLQVDLLLVFFGSIRHCAGWMSCVEDGKCGNRRRYGWNQLSPAAPGQR
jgi:hypothetical protein